MIYSENALALGARISEIRIHHSKFKEALDGIGRVIQVGNYLPQPAGISVIAPAGAGKTLLINSIQNNVCDWPFLSPNSVLVASLKEAPNVSQIQNDLLSGFNYAIAPRSSPKSNASSFNLLVDAIKHHDIRLIALDEYQHVFLARGGDMHASITDWTKRLMSATGRPVLLSGTEMLGNVEKGDPQLSTRIPTVITLPAFKNDAKWRGVLKAFASGIPDMDLTSLCDNHATATFKATKGKMRLLKTLIVEASMIAFDSSEKKVTADHLHQAFQRVFGVDSSLANPFK